MVKIVVFESGNKPYIQEIQGEFIEIKEFLAQNHKEHFLPALKQINFFQASYENKIQILYNAQAKFEESDLKSCIDGIAGTFVLFKMKDNCISNFSILELERILELYPNIERISA